MVTNSFGYKHIGYYIRYAYFFTVLFIMIGLYQTEYI